MLYQLEVQLGVAGEHLVLVGGLKSRVDEQARICILIVGAEGALQRVTSDSCLPQGCH
jgi:NCAIR mutase (PurE)-related protein